MNLQEKILFYEIKAHSIESKEIQTKTEVGRTRFNSNFFKLHITEGY